MPYTVLVLGVVIIGAMFKILHLPGANVVLGTGMICEAIIFTGRFYKPFKEYHWDKIFDFENGTTKFQTELIGSGTVSAAQIYHILIILKPF